MLVQLRDEFVADAEGFNEHRRQHEIIRFGEDVKVRRNPQAVACRKRYAQELGRPQELLKVGAASVGYTATETQKGKPGHGIRLEPTRR